MWSNDGPAHKKRINKVKQLTPFNFLKKIDIHTHIMPEHMPNWVKKFGYGEFIHLEHNNCKACMMKGDKLFREVEPN